MALDRSQLLGATALPWEEVRVPELGGTVIVQGMTGSERDAFEAALFRMKRGRREFSQENLRARLVVLSVVDTPGGSRIFSDADIPAVGRIRADVLQRLFNVAQRLSGISDEDVDELGKPSPTPEAGTTSSMR